MFSSSTHASALLTSISSSSSTLENWCREFARFAPSISVQTYYAGKEERPHLRQTLSDTQACTSETGEGWEVLITTYNLAQGDEKDRKFFRRIEWDVSTCSGLVTLVLHLTLPSAASSTRVMY